jgi:hypothetical protein
MRGVRGSVCGTALWVVGRSILVLVAVGAGQGQVSSYERAFPQSKATVENALSSVRGSLAGHLPVLDGFAQPGDRPLDRYQRGYFQSSVQVSSSASGGSIVRISTKVTAWYADPAGTHSGYELLTSNGRLESDLLDQLAEQLAKSPAERNNPPPAPGSRKPALAPPVSGEPTVSAPAPKFPESERTFSSSVSQGLSEQIRTGGQPSDALSDKSNGALQTEAESLEEILKNTAHPKNLVAVKKSGTPVVATPTLTAKPQFLASMHDEFEMLDFNADWVHVRISGLSRGWIWRNSVEMPNGISDVAAPAAAPAMASAADLFHVIHEEASTFPGDWEPLKNKNVKIISVQKIDENPRNAGAAERLEYAKFLLEKSYKEITQKPQDLAGIVVIFDSADGGMVAATLPTLQQWRAGTLSDSALWRKCFLDPPETFDSTAPSGSQ